MIRDTTGQKERVTIECRAALEANVIFVSVLKLQCKLRSKKPTLMHSDMLITWKSKLCSL